MQLWEIAFYLSIIFWPISLYLNYSRLPTPSIITIDYQSRQEVLRNTYLYPNIPLARTFQNKAIVLANKFYDNLFVLIDPNNYFFGFAPRQIVGKQNLIKFPFMAFIPFLVTLFSLRFNKKVNYFASIFIALIITLSLLSNFDSYDFVLWLPIVFLLYTGFEKLARFKYSIGFYAIYIFFALIELIRIISI